MAKKQKNLAACCPLLAWEPPFLVSKNADATLAFELELPPLFSLSVSAYEQMHQTWIRALRSLPDYTVVHRQDVYAPRTLKMQVHNKAFLEQASRAHFQNRSYLDQRSFLFITLSSEQAIRGTSLASILCANRVVPAERLLPNNLQDFKESVDNFCFLLQEEGILLRPLTEKELLGSPQHLGWIERYLNLQFQAEEGVLCDQSTQGPTFQVGSNYLSVFSLHSLDALPSKVHNYLPHPVYSEGERVLPMDYLHTLQRALPFPHMIQSYFIMEPAAQIIAQLEKRGREQAALSKIARQNAVHQQGNEAYIQAAVSQHKRPVRMAWNLWFWDTDYTTLLSKNAQVAAHLLALDACPTKVEGILPVLFWAGVPGGASQYPYEMTALTFLEPATCFLGQTALPSLSTSPWGIRLCERMSGLPLSIDLSEEPMQKGIINNRNKFILGPSGSGKSFFTNHLLRQYYDQGCHILLVDVGDSYQGLCTLIHEESGGKDGVYFSYTEEHPIAFNPFWVSDEGYSIEKREQLSSLIFCLWKNENETITKAEETHLAAAINGYIQALSTHKYSVNFNGFYDYLQTEFVGSLQQQQVSAQHFDVANLLQVLRPYATGGMYEFLLNASESIDVLDQRFIVFEIDAIKDHKTLFPVVTLILMDTFLSKMRHAQLASCKKVILIEEAWKAISKTGTAEFIKYLFKTVRKHFGEAIVVTQDLEDIIGNEIVKNAILSNADCKILLDQRKYAHRFDQVQEVLALRAEEVPMVLSLNQDLHFEGRNKYKEVFISLNGQASRVYGVEVSPQEYWTYTTEKKEKAALWKAYEQGGSFIQAVQQMVQASEHSL